MANLNAPFGLRPVKYAWGAPYNGACRAYFATGASGAIYIGDGIVLNGTSNTAEVQGYKIGSLTGCSVSAVGDGDPMHGVCVGVLPVTRDSTTYREDSTDRVIFVADDPNLIFEVQTDTAGTDWAVTDVGSYANMLTGSGSNTTGLSGWTADTSDGPDTADVSNQLLVMGVSQRVDNEIGEYAVFEVLINNHGYANVADAGRFTAV